MLTELSRLAQVAMASKKTLLLRVEFRMHARDPGEA
jgi:hypothetical protein